MKICQFENTEKNFFGFECFPFIFSWAESHEPDDLGMNNYQLKCFDPMKALVLDKEAGHTSLCKEKLLGKFSFSLYYPFMRLGHLDTESNFKSNWPRLSAYSLES